MRQEDILGAVVMLGEFFFFFTYVHLEATPWLHILLMFFLIQNVLPLQTYCACQYSVDPSPFCISMGDIHRDVRGAGATLGTNSQ